MTDYVYAPKDDPKHRERWRDPYDADELAGFERFAAEGALRLGFAISPGLSMDYDEPSDRDALAAKVDQVVAVGAGLVVLALDDIPFGGGPQGEAHARLTTWLRDHLGDGPTLVLVPTEYVGHPVIAAPRRAGGGRAGGRADRVDRTGRRQRRDHRGRRSPTGRVARRTAAAALGQLSRSTTP